MAKSKDTSEDMNEILATVTVSAPRRWLALGMLALLGVLLVHFGFSAPPESLLLQVFVIALGIASMALAVKMHRGTSSTVELTRAGLRDGDGTVMAPIEMIERVDRGAFAFKPSNGFMLRLSKGQGRVWRPGLWWRLGRRVGVGGVTPGNQTKVMAEILQVLIAEK